MLKGRRLVRASSRGGAQVGDETQVDCRGGVPLDERSDGLDRGRHDGPARSHAVSRGGVPLDERSDRLDRGRDHGLVRDPLPFGLGPRRKGFGGEAVLVEAAVGDGVAPGEGRDVDPVRMRLEQRVQPRPLLVVIRPHRDPRAIAWEPVERGAGGIDRPDRRCDARIRTGYVRTELADVAVLAVVQEDRRRFRVDGPTHSPHSSRLRSTSLRAAVPASRLHPRRASSAFRPRPRSGSLGSRS